MYQPPSPFQLVYPDKTGCTNVLLIENEMKDPTVFYVSANELTFPILYSPTSSKNDLLTLLRSKFTTIDRIALAFNSNLGTIKQFLDNQPFFSDESTENVTFIISLIQEFNVKHIDYLACQTLNYPIWTNYYDTLENATGVVVGASNDQTGNLKYGGDWVLENTTQDIELLYFTESIEYYQYVLDTTYVTLATLTNGPLQVISDGTYIYTLGGGTIISRMNLNGTNIINNFGPALPSNCMQIITYGGFIYASDQSAGKIYQLDMTANMSNANFTPSKTGYAGPIAMVTDGINFYVSYYYSGTINKYDMSGALVTANWISGVAYPLYMSIDNGIFYLVLNGNAANGAATISKYNLSTGALITASWATGLSNPNVPRIYGPHLYISNIGGAAVTQILLSTGVTVSSTFVSGFTELNSMVIVGSAMYLANNSPRTISLANLPPPLVCFKEGSLILTDNGYVPIQNLRRGALVKTLLHGYVAIYMIAKLVIPHRPSLERTKNQLYVCTNDTYPELLGPLVMTGCHSILVDEYSSYEERERAIKVNGGIYITEDQYRLPVCADERARVYDKKGTYTIYHISLENNDYYMNYGIYANGLLVETCSKRYLKELSNMEII